MSYSFDKVKKECLKYFKNDELATNVIMNKYLLRNDDGEFLENSPDDMIKNRIVKEFVRIEKKYSNSLTEEEIYKSMKDFKYIVPQGSPLFGIGNNQQTVSIGNCFVIGTPYDSYGGILKKDEELAQLMKRRGGVGIDISTLRPRGSLVNNSARTSDGISCFMERFSNTTKEVAQNGRRGALMISISCNHPDLEYFINIKRDKTRVTGANISIKWNDEALNAIKNDEEYTLRFPVNSSVKDAKITKTVKIKKLWDEYIKSNWEGAEPGCFFWDTITKQSISDCYADEGFKTITSNPCGEILMSEYNSCILLLVNLKSFIDNPYTDKALFNKEKFEKYIRMATRLIDDMIDLEIEKVKQIISKVKKDPEKQDIKKVELNLWTRILDCYERGRRTGLGVTGLGDMIASMNIKYDSEESLKFTEKVFKLFHLYTYDENSILAKERGAFSIWNWEKEKNSHYIKILPKETQDKIKKYGRRNIASNTCAPAGSISILTKTSSGIEPIYMLSYIRNRKLNQEEIDKGIKENYTDSDGIKWISTEVFHEGVNQWKEINKDKNIKESFYYGSEAGQLDWRFRVKLQGLINKYIDHSLSSTVNLKKDIPIEEVSELYFSAWRHKCKGITIYRDGCRQGVLVAKTESENETIKINHAPKRKKVLPCEIHYSNIKNTKNEVHNWILFVGLYHGMPYEIFGGKKKHIEIPNKYKTGWVVKNGKNEQGQRTYDLYLGNLEDTEERIIVKNVVQEFSPNVTSYTRIISAMLRHGIPIKIITEQLYKDSESHLFSFEKGIARVLKKYIGDGEKANGICLKCNGELQYRDGCVICIQCGDSKCN